MTLSNGSNSFRGEKYKISNYDAQGNLIDQKDLLIDNDISGLLTTRTVSNSDILLPNDKLLLAYTSEKDSEPNLFLQLYNLNGQKIGNKLNLDDFGSTTTNHGILVKAISESEIYVLTNTPNGNSNQALKLKVENNELKLDEIIENIHAGIGNRGINSDLFVFSDQTVNIYSQFSSDGATQVLLGCC